MDFAGAQQQALACKNGYFYSKDGRKNHFQVQQSAIERGHFI